MESYRYEMTIGGQKFVLRTTENKEYLDSLVEFVNDRIEEIAKEGIASSAKCALLASFYIADELFKLKSNRPDNLLNKHYVKKLDTLMRKIDNAIK